MTKKFRFENWNGARAAWMLLAAFLVLVFALGGGSRSDILSLLVLRPLSFVFLAAGLFLLDRQSLFGFKTLWLLAAAIVALALIHLIPLPHAIWTALPGRELAAEITRVAGLGQMARPLSLTPWSAYNAAFALAIPLAALVLAARAGWVNRSRLLTVLVVIGLASAMLGILQIIGPRDNVLYLYRVTNDTSAVGLFANRNHHAVFLASMIPMLAIFATEGKVPRRGATDYRMVRFTAAVAGIVLCLITIIISGSRAGFGLGLLALASILWVDGRAPSAITTPPGRALPKNRSAGRIAIGAAIALVAALGAAVVIVGGRETVLNRLNESAARGEIWRVTAAEIWRYFPWGSGNGSFVEVFQIAEPREIVHATYTNHAHNDFLEVALTLGLPGIAILVVALGGFLIAGDQLVRTRKEINSETRYARLGWTLIGFLGLASIVDYPLRTPSLACLLVVASIWLTAGQAQTRRRSN